MSRQPRGSQGRFTSLFKRLMSDTAGNVMGLVLMTILLLMSLAGSGIDMSRAYMARTSLQNACDAGVLAGRKALTKSATYGATESAQANKMFNFNFNARETKSASTTFSSQSDGKGSVTGAATTQMPTSIMALAGLNNIALSVSCSAELQMSSADVMFVLDVTGSMADCPDNSNCNSGAGSKIVGLRNAVASFYSTVAAAVVDPTQSRIRFAFVPYNATVNMRTLVASGAMPTSYFADTAPYQTRLYNFNTPVQVGAPETPVNTTEQYASDIKSAECDDYGKNAFPSASGTNPVVSGGPAPAETESTTYSYGSWVKVSGSKKNAVGTCIRNVSATKTKYVTRYQFTDYRWTQSNVDVSAYKSLGSVAVADSVDTATATVPNAGYYNKRQLATMVGTAGVTGVNTKNDAWSGCIEERQTVQTGSWSPIPAGATDHDMNSAPSSDDATKWKIAVDDLVFNRGTYNAIYDSASTSGTRSINQSCPAPAMQFTNVDVSAPTVVPGWLNTYLNSLVATGNTYHDIGMIWGGRLGSTTGMFQSNVNAPFGAGVQTQISRHIIFMTDGDMAPSATTYSAYGLEQNDQRVDAQGSGNLRNRHNARFLAACGRAKELGYTVWVIGFGTALSSELTTCATAGRAYFAADTTALTNTFRFIAGQVADLRINK